MSNTNSINLIRSKTVTSAQMDILTERLSLASRIGLGVFFVAAILVGGMYYYFVNRQQALADEESNLSSQIAQNATKEGLYTTLKQRIGVVEKTLVSQRNWAPVVDAIVGIAKPPALTAIALDDQNRVQFTLKAASLDEIVGMVNAFLGASEGANLRNPQLVSFQLLADGTVQVVISCISVS